MRLSELLAPEMVANVPPDIEIAGVTADSRAVAPGDLFVAIAGAEADGAAFAAAAVAGGAVAVLAAPDADLADLADLADAPVVRIANPRRALARLAARLAGPQPDRILAVTGTNGKTSVAHFAAQILEGVGRPAASVGTLGVSAPGFEDAPSLTTADPVALHGVLADLAACGIRDVAMEASSHGLAQHRLDGVRLSAAAFTNLSRDHLDYHGDMAAYRAAKTRLFSELLPSGGVAVLNADAPEAHELERQCRTRGHWVVRFGSDRECDIRLMFRTPDPMGQRIVYSVEGREFAASLDLVGEFQAANVLCALGLAMAAGADLDEAADFLPRLQGAPGRLERVAAHPNGAPVYVDYAHTPDALETVLRAMRPHCRGRLAVIFGCGGDRDRGKRPGMGDACRRNADLVYLTDDNPRTEDPVVIRAEALVGCPDAIEIGDRREAIRAALAALRPDDVLIVAGKGHELGQIVGDAVLPFLDRDEARTAVEAISGGCRDAGWR